MPEHIRGTRSPERAKQPRKRRRPAVSCVQCRRRKIKCDRDYPCRSCVAGDMQCTYARYHTPQNDEVLQTDYGQTKLPYLDRQPGSSTSLPAQSGGSALANVNGTEPPYPGAVTDGSHQGTVMEFVESRHPNGNTQELQNSDGAREPARITLGYTSELKNRHISMNKSRASRWSQWIAESPEFSNVVACFSAMAGSDDNSGFREPKVKSQVEGFVFYLQECQKIAGSIKVDRPSPGSFRGPIAFALPSRAIADGMIRNYFFYFELTHRILHEGTFEKDYGRFWHDPENAPMSLRLQVVLVLAIGSSVHLSKDEQMAFRKIRDEWIHAAQTWLSESLEKDRLTIEGVQVHCLAILARQVLGTGDGVLWSSVGSLVHQAMEIGLHRDPKFQPPMSAFQTELRRRLWATICELVVQASLDSDMPPRISLDEFDTEAPSNIFESDIDRETVQPITDPSAKHTRESIQLFLYSSLRIRLRIVQLLNGLSPDIPYEEALALSDGLAWACGVCQDFTDSRKVAYGSPFIRRMLDLLVQRFLLYLHCPFSCRAALNTAFTDSRILSVETALAIESAEPNSAFSNLLVRGSGPFGRGSHHGSISIMLELLAMVSEQRASGTLHLYVARRTLLKESLRKMIRISWDRIQCGRSSLKSYIFLEMVFAEVEAMESSSHVEEAIARAARDQIKICYVMMEHRAQEQSNTDQSLARDDEGMWDLDWNFDVGEFLRDESFV